MGWIDEEWASHACIVLSFLTVQISVDSWARTESVCLDDHEAPSLSSGSMLDEAILKAEEEGESVWLWVPPFREMARLKAYIAVLLRSIQYHVQVCPCTYLGSQ